MTDTINYSDSKKLLNDLYADALKANMQGRRWALIEARREKRYRQEQENKWAQARLVGKIGEDGVAIPFKTATEMDPWVAGQVAELREKRDVARVMADSEKSLEYTIRQFMSAQQTVMRLGKSDNDMHSFNQATDVPEPDMPPFEDHA